MLLGIELGHVLGLVYLHVLPHTLTSEYVPLYEDRQKAHEVPDYASKKPDVLWERSVAGEFVDAQ